MYFTIHIRKVLDDINHELCNMDMVNIGYYSVNNQEVQILRIKFVKIGQI